jgi:Cu-processing system permease protein
MSIIPIAYNTYKESVRDKILYVILLFSVFMTGTSFFLSALSLGQNNKIVVDLGLASINIFGVLITLFVGTSLLYKEIDKKTIYLLLSKPLRRSDFIIGKHLGLSLTLFVVVSLMTVFFYGIILVTGAPVIIEYLWAILLSYMELVVLIAVALVFSTISPPIMSSLYTLAIYIIGHFSNDLVAFGKMTQNETIVTITKAIYYILPDLEKFNVKNLVVYSADKINYDLITGSIGYGLLYTFMLLSLAVLSFELKDF